MEKSLKDFKVLLENRVKKASRVFVVPHFHVDLDAIGSAAGMVEICNHFGTEAAIVMDDSLLDMNVGIRSVYDSLIEKYTILRSKELTEYRNQNDLLITVDVNKRNLLPPDLQDIISTFPRIVVLDHHKEDEMSLQTDDKYIDISTSSTCEMITRLFKLYNIRLTKQLANCFLAGIFLDTSKLKKNTNEKTLEIAARLIRNGASIQDVNDLFVEDFENDRKVQHLIDGTEFIPYNIHNVAIICNSADSKTIYSQAELAQAADYLLQYKVDAAYAIGLLSDTEIGISARTLGGMNIAEVMHVFRGGGNEHSAAARIMNSQDLGFIKNELMRLICQEAFYTVKSTALAEEVKIQKEEEAKVAVLS